MQMCWLQEFWRKPRKKDPDALGGRGRSQGTAANSSENEVIFSDFGFAY